MKKNIEYEVLTKYPVLEEVRKILQDEDSVYHNPRTWIWIYATIAAKEGMHK